MSKAPEKSVKIRQNYMSKAPDIPPEMINPQQTNLTFKNLQRGNP